MKAGMLVAKLVEMLLSKFSKNATVETLIAYGLPYAEQIVTKVINQGAAKAITFIASKVGFKVALDGPIGQIVGNASSWL